MLYLSIAVILIAAVYLYLRNVWFYRHPSRIPSEREGAIISPADGQIVYIRQFSEGAVVSQKLEDRLPLTDIVASECLPPEGWIIGIYMSPLDVHYNYAPLGGSVRKIIHIKTGLNLPMLDMLEYIRITFLRRAIDTFSKKFHLHNERNIFFIEGDLKIAVVEIADKYINKITSLVKEGAMVKPGEEIGFIGRGSQVDLVIFSKDIKIVVQFGQQVFGGKTAIARYRP